MRYVCCYGYDPLVHLGLVRSSRKGEVLSDVSYKGCVSRDP